MKNIDAYDLGATLFLPANHKNLEAVVLEAKYPTLKSVVIDFEDALFEDDILDALARFKRLLTCKKSEQLLLFVRARHQGMLEEFLGYEGIEKIDGFLLAKLSLSSLENYLEILEDREFYIMPSVESEELFDTQKLRAIREKLIPIADKIVVVRFGLEDMLKMLEIKRNCEDTIFDSRVLSQVIINFMLQFKPFGFHVSAGVYPCFKNVEMYSKQIEEEFREGLVSKTVIHPNQIMPLHELYRVSEEEVANAEAILDATKAVFNLNDTMAEVHTQKRYAKSVLKRFKLYGLREK